MTHDPPGPGEGVTPGTDGAGATPGTHGVGKPAAATPRRALGLFEGYGVEIEYMIVDARSLDVRPVADRLIERAAGRPESQVEWGDLAWSNELTLHVIELKTDGPAGSLDGLAALFQDHVERIDALLQEEGARLMPGGMHPWMDPVHETRLWPHEYNDVYRTFDRVFGCAGHGWSNLQSTHLNLPFDGDEEFGRLHSAIRCLLPILPALAASSPFVDGRPAGVLDARLAAYRENARRVPSVTGRVIPEAVGTREEYDRRILRPIYDDLEAFDPDGVLRHEWVNARGAIARFDRGAIEVRLLDVQERPAADLAVLTLLAEAVRAIASGTLGNGRKADELSTESLAGVLDATVREGEEARVEDTEYLRVLGVPGKGARTAGEVWSHIVDRTAPRLSTPVREDLQPILRHGPLSRRLLRAAGPSPTRQALRQVYRTLCDGLIANEPFLP